MIGETGAFCGDLLMLWLPLVLIISGEVTGKAPVISGVFWTLTRLVLDVVVAIFCFPFELRWGVSFFLIGVASISSMVGLDLDPTSGNTVDRNDSAISVPRLPRLDKVLLIVS